MYPSRIIHYGWLRLRAAAPASRAKLVMCYLEKGYGDVYASIREHRKNCVKLFTKLATL
jgi:hypothetical protein